MRNWLVVIGLLVLLIAPPLPVATAEQCDTSADAAGQYFGVQASCATPPQAGGAEVAPASTTSEPSPFVAYRWASMCTPSPGVEPGDLDCTAAVTCASPDQRRWQLWGERRGGGWVTIRTQCFGGAPPAAPLPTVTPGDVLSALRRVGLPELVARVQPDGKTLVNLDTIFHTDSAPVSVDLTILGQAVEVVATPQTYHWVFGDGTSRTTSTPGEPYPARTITHRYGKARVTVFPHVEVSYGGRFRVNGGGWQDIGGTVTTVGPPTALRVAEATPVLSGNHR